LFAPGQTLNIYNLPLQAQYTPDFFLLNRDHTRAAKFWIQYQNEQLKAAILTLSSRVAKTYYELLQTQALMVLQQRLTQTEADRLRLARVQFEAGLSDGTNIERYSQQWRQAQEQLSELTRQARVLQNQLAVDTATTPDKLPDLTLPLWETARQQLNEATPLQAGYPSDLVTHRPDVRAYEALLERTRIDVRVARKEFLPVFNLTGQVGFASSRLKNWIDWDSLLASVAASMSQSLFSGGQKVANLRVFKARHEQQLMAYQQAILLGFQQVEDTLASYQQHQALSQTLTEERMHLASLESLNQQRYDHGLINFLPVLETRIQQLALQRSWIQAQSGMIQDRLSLIAALGGGL
jgi:multidrug efflux system outer membrane protein